jgi:murein DD-endopeptidase MepM/ murein hydrolase activator NlpD
MSIYYEKRTLNGEPAPDGKVLAAKFINEGEEYFGYYYELEGEGGHYDSEGKELLRQFLRAPLSYRRITSGYTGARLHPITKTVTAHYQIDYAAPIGTPVVATARGTVTSAGYEGGWGNMVRLRHDNGYSTHYGHLSAYGKNIKAGTSVSQGQVIGYVGSTGWSTGPHLDYGMRLNGSPINPLSLKLPKGTPLEGADLENFQKIKQEYDQYLK